MTDQMIATEVNKLEARLDIYEDDRDVVIGALMGLDPLLGMETEYSALWDGNVPNADILCRCVGKADIDPRHERQGQTLKDLRPMLIDQLNGLDDKIQSTQVILASLKEDA